MKSLILAEIVPFSLLQKTADQCPIAIETLSNEKMGHWSAINSKKMCASLKMRGTYFDIFSRKTLMNN
jgi:hypothetical protein